LAAGVNDTFGAGVPPCAAVARPVALALYTELFAINRRDRRAAWAAERLEGTEQMAQAEIGIIGGSGLYSMPGFTNVHEESVETPFGAPSDSFVLGELEGRNVAFLARHGRGHRLMPSELNFRANIYAMKKLGVERIVSVSAVGSLKEEHKPTDFVVPDQFIDRTSRRISTFFGDGIVGHVAFGDPVCATVAKAAIEACASVGVVGKLGGTYICMEGPQFSTKAESRLYRSWGADVIGMTNLQEAKLAREAEICYATIAMVTDYDCWREGHESVSVEQIVAVLHQNAENACRVVKAAVASLPKERNCACATAAKYAVLTQPDAIPETTRAKVKLLFGKYLGW
jgi:5'-methylthioadenosine phosphorylase